MLPSVWPLRRARSGDDPGTIRRRSARPIRQRAALFVNDAAPRDAVTWRRRHRHRVVTERSPSGHRASRGITRRVTEGGHGGQPAEPVTSVTSVAGVVEGPGGHGGIGRTTGRQQTTGGGCVRHGGGQQMTPPPPPPPPPPADAADLAPWSADDPSDCGRPGEGEIWAIGGGGGQRPFGGVVMLTG